jgi:hypothetical protein
MSINVVVSSTAAGVSVSGGTAVAITVGGGIGPAGFLVAPGTATNAFGTFQLTAGDGITISTSAAQFQIASYGTAAVAGFSPVQSVAGRTGNVVLQAADVTAGTFAIARIPTISYTALSNVPTTFSPSAHTHSTADIVSFTASAAAAAPVQSVAGRTGAISLAAADVSGLASVATSGSYTSLSNVPTAFAPETHSHSTADVVGFTAAAALAAPVQNIVAGSNVTVSTSTSGIYTIAAGGGTATGTDLGAATPLPLGVATAGTATAASREDHVHDLPTISYTALTNVPVSFAPDTSVANVVSVNGQTGSVTIALGDALPAQSGSNTRLLTTDGTNASWATRYSVVDPVVLAGAGIAISRDTAAGEITIGANGGIVGTTAALVETKSPSTSQNNYAIGSGNIIRLNPSANVTLTGIAGGEDGVVRLLYNVSTHVVTLATGSTSSAETNRFTIVSGDVSLQEGDSASVWYDATSGRWRVMEDQSTSSGGSGGGAGYSYLFG